MNQISVRPGPQELLRQMSPALYREAYGKGMSLSAYLEQQDPSEEYKDGLDAFGRLLKCANIRTLSLPELGVWADEFDAFNHDDTTRMLVPEWMARQWRMAASGREVLTRALYTSGDSIPGSSMSPWVEAGQARASRIAPAIPLSRLVAITTAINSDAYRAYYLTDVTAQERMARVSEGAEIPRVKLTGGEHTTRLYKYGRVLEASYESLRRMRIDRIALHIARLAVQNESDKVATALDVLVNGDGNAGTAATSYNLTDLDTATAANNPTWKAWLAFEMKFTNPYVLNVALMTEAIALQVRMLNVGTANAPVPASKFSTINPDGGTVGIGWTSAAPANTIVGIDTRFALEHVVEVGADIQEIERWSTRQVQTLTMTEVEGFNVFDQGATKLIAVNA